MVPGGKRSRIQQRVVGVLTLVALLVGGLTLPPALSGNAAEPVHLVVELTDDSSDLNAAGRNDVYHARARSRTISNRAPRTYQASTDIVRAGDLRKFKVIEVDAARADHLTRQLSQNPTVASVRREHTYHSTRTPNDPLFPEQYAVNPANSIADAKLTSAWNKTTGSSGTLIAILDGGVDLTHEDLRNKIWQNNDSPNGVDNDGNGFIDDTNGWDFVENKPAGYAHKHGTHVAGIAAAQGDNGRGIAGADWGARIMSVRVLNRSGAGREEWIVQGINYAVANGANIINLSIAGSPSNALAAAIEDAYAAGVTVVAAAGNHGSDTGRLKVYPACADVNGVNMVLGVGATDDDGEPASFSNYGNCVDISAPGKSIVSTTPGNKYGKMSGTSMSAPLAAGVAGLYKAINPGASPSQVINALRQGDPFVDLDDPQDAAEWTARYKGKLNAARVVGAAIENPTPAPPPADNPAPNDDNSDDQDDDPAPAGEPNLTTALSGPGEVANGTTITYELTARNTGTAAASAVQLTADVDRDLVFTGAAGCRADRSDIICDVGNLAAGASVSRPLTFSIPEEEFRCGSRLSARGEVSIEERGRQRRQASSDRLRTTLTCE